MCFATLLIHIKIKNFVCKFFNHKFLQIILFKVNFFQDNLLYDFRNIYFHIFRNNSQFYAITNNYVHKEVINIGQASSAFLKPQCS